MAKRAGDDPEAIAQLEQADPSAGLPPQELLERRQQFDDVVSEIFVQMNRGVDEKI